MAGHGGTWREVAGGGTRRDTAGTAANAGIACIAGDSRVLQGSQKPIVLHGIRLLAKMVVHHQQEDFVTPKTWFSIRRESVYHIYIDRRSFCGMEPFEFGASAKVEDVIASLLCKLPLILFLPHIRISLA